MEVIHHHLRSSTKVGVIIYYRRPFVPSGTGLFVASAEAPFSISVVIEAAEAAA
jgi:hypothetical protein